MTAKLFVLFLNFCLVSGALISLETELGTLIGQKKVVQNRPINVFYGVPYAEPPVGQLRFRRTKVIKKFPTDPYTALSYKTRCPQQLPSYYAYNGTFDEDCKFCSDTFSTASLIHPVTHHPSFLSIRSTCQYLDTESGNRKRSERQMPETFECDDLYLRRKVVHLCAYSAYRRKW